MNLGDLREQIDDLVEKDGEEILEMEVYAEYDYGDHCHTRALVMVDDIDTLVPRKSAYSDSGLAIGESHVGKKVFVFLSGGGR